MRPQQFGALVLGALGGIAVILTVLGIYVLAESMAIQRQREMGIRAALGACGRQLAYDFRLEFVRETDSSGLVTLNGVPVPDFPSSSADKANGPSIFVALKRTTGLKTNSSKRPG